MVKQDTVDVNGNSQVFENRKDHSGLWTGLFLVVAGAVALARSFQVPMPNWLFDWQTMLIVIGIFLGIRGNFRGRVWILMILVGVAFLLNDYYFLGDLGDHVWPLLIIAMGAVFILRPKQRKKGWAAQKITDGRFATVDTNGNFADITVVFGSLKKRLDTQTFEGGDITSIFAGAEVDLTNCNFQGRVVMDITTVFGGAEIIIPSDWTIKSEIVSVFGAVQDKRISSSDRIEDPNKVLVLDGTALFGGIEIRNFKK